MSGTWIIRPRTLFISGIISLIIALGLAAFKAIEPAFWLFYIASIVFIGAAYLYFSVSLIERGRKAIGCAIIWVPLAAYMIGSPEVSELWVAILFASVDAAIIIGAVMLGLHVARWAESRLSLPVHFA